MENTMSAGGIGEYKINQAKTNFNQEQTKSNAGTTFANTIAGVLGAGISACSFPRTILDVETTLATGQTTKINFKANRFGLVLGGLLLLETISAYATNGKYSLVNFLMSKLSGKND
jgi:hypothetical protein